jgi:hypothetical protein
MLSMPGYADHWPCACVVRQAKALQSPEVQRSISIGDVNVGRNRFLQHHRTVRLAAHRCPKFDRALKLALALQSSPAET